MTEPDGNAFTAALTQELGKKTAVSWLRYDGRQHPAWHTWLDDALYVVSGGDEQPLPGIEECTGMEVVMRSKENGGRLITWVAEVSVVHPTDALWEPVTRALVTGRLNLDDLTTAAAGWADRSVVSRIVPTGRLVESPDALGDESHRAPPAATGATTRGPLPRILHRRARRRPRLS